MFSDRDLMRPLRSVSYAGALVCGYGLFVLSILVGFDVVSRKFFGYSVPGIDDLGGYMLAVVAAVGYSHTLLTRAHTRIDMVLALLPKLGQAIIDVVAVATMAAFALFMAWQAILTFRLTLVLGSVAVSPLPTPLWIPQSLWLAGQLLFAAVATACTVHAIYLFAKRRDEIFRHYGLPSIGETLAEEGKMQAPVGDGR